MSEEAPERIMPLAEAVKRMGWDKGRVRRAVRLGAPTHQIGTKSRHKLGVRASELEAWRIDKEALFAIEPKPQTRTSAGWVVYPPCEGIVELLRRASDRAKDRYHNHVCMAWDTKRSREMAYHFRVDRVRKALLVRCGKCLEVRISMNYETAWPITLREPAERP